MATSNQRKKGASTDEQTTLWQYGQAVTERSSDSCENGEEYCCGPDGITILDDGENFEHDGHFPCFACFMEACRNADAEVLK